MALALIFAVIVGFASQCHLNYKMLKRLNEIERNIGNEKV